MKKSTVEKAVSFFYPYFHDRTDIVFFGGEPLLTQDLVEYGVNILEEKNRDREKILKYTLTTNGSLLTDDMLSFFNRHGFKIALSFDGRNQDVTRRAGTLQSTRELIPKFRSYSGINFLINTVSTPETISGLSESIRDIIEFGGTDIQLTIDQSVPWEAKDLESLEKELDRLAFFLLEYYRENRSIPVLMFRPVEAESEKKQCFACGGGRDRISIGPEEYIKGCILFEPYLRNRTWDKDFDTYSFGTLDEFIENHQTIYPRILANYLNLRQDSFFTEDKFCYLCEDVEYCAHCPPYFAYATSFIGKIPKWSCRISGIERSLKKQFNNKLENIRNKEHATGES